MTVTTLPPDLLAHLAAVRDGACDDADLLVLADRLNDAGECDREELLRLSVTLENWPHRRNPNPTEFDWELRPRCGNHWCDESICHQCRSWLAQITKYRDLLSRNPSWLAVSDPPGGIPAAIERGFLSVTLPHTLCWRLEEVPSTRCLACRGRGARAWHAGVSGQGCGECGNHDTIDVWRPHPVLRAVLESAVGPWVRRVRVEGREPFVDHHRDSAGWQRRSAGMRAWHDSPPSEREPYLIHDPVFDLLGGEPGVGHSRRFPTPEAATDALSLAVPIWARGAM